jgi:Excreted virulence factor EspC, type VII ESX diderm
MPDQVGVRHAEIVTHAGRLEAIADRITATASAGATVRAGADAYGKLCATVPVMLNSLQDVLIDGIRATAESLRDTGGRLRATASEYETTDRRRADVFRQIGGRM